MTIRKAQNNTVNTYLNTKAFIGRKHLAGYVDTKTEQSKKLN